MKLDTVEIHVLYRSDVEADPSMLGGGGGIWLVSASVDTIGNWLFARVFISWVDNHSNNSPNESWVKDGNLG